MNDLSITLPGGAMSISGLMSGDPASVRMIVAGWIIVTILICCRDIAKAKIDASMGKPGSDSK